VPAAAWLMIGFAGSFAFIRMSTRLMRSPKVTWWPGSVSSGGVHVHHLVFGIVLMIIAGFISVSLAPDDVWEKVVAVAFGIGVGLTLDEFALFLHLEDVYWSQEGRQSLEATMVALGAGTFVVLGINPFESDTETEGFVVLAITIAISLFASGIAFAKGKYWLGFIGLFITIVGYVAAIRVARPNSPWARWRYEGKEKKLKKAEEREVKWSRRRTRWWNLMGGAPDKPSPLADKR
jgi:hypothetical protein